MISIKSSRTILQCLLAGGALCVAFSLPAAAQVKSTETVEHGTAAKEVKIERGEIVYVSGNDLVVKMEDGSLRNFFNVPDSATITVAGKQLNVHQVKPGMKVEKQTITASTPRVITKVETVTGKVWHVTPPNSVTLTLEDGTNQTFKIPKGQKFTINGEETDAFDLKKGMVVSAQRVTETPETVVTQEVRRSGTMPPPPPAPKPDVPILIATAPPAPASVEEAKAEPAPARLPKTASELPLIGLLGALFCGISLMMIAIRKLAAGFHLAE
jgi:RNase P/RNase MRP subunit p29